jgi:hypothetical protein
MDEQKEPQPTDEERRSAVTKYLRARYPSQKFGKPGSEYVIDNETETDLLMWTRVIEFAKEGQFDRIRPDIYVNNFANLKAIHIDALFNARKDEEKDKDKENE